MKDRDAALIQLHSHLLLSAKPDGDDRTGMSKHAVTGAEGSSISSRSLNPYSRLGVGGPEIASLQK